MKKILLFILILLPQFLYAQETRKMQNKKGKETYHVLKADKNTKQGTYIKRSYEDKILVKGQYENNKKSGIWEFYDLQGELVLKYDYSNDSIVFNEMQDIITNKKYKVLEPHIGKSLTREPIYLGGDAYIISEVFRNIKYPAYALRNKKTGEVMVSFTVDKNGKTSNFHVKKPEGYGLDEEAIRVLELLPDNWLPGLIDEEAIDVEVDFPVLFLLE